VFLCLEHLGERPWPRPVCPLDLGPNHFDQALAAPGGFRKLQPRTLRRNDRQGRDPEQPAASLRRGTPASLQRRRPPTKHPSAASNWCTANCIERRWPTFKRDAFERAGRSHCPAHRAAGSPQRCPLPQPDSEVCATSPAVSRRSFKATRLSGQAASHTRTPETPAAVRPRPPPIWPPGLAPCAGSRTRRSAGS